MRSLYALLESQPLDPTMSFDLWTAFRDRIFNWLLLTTLVGALLILMLYTIHSRRLTIRSPQDLFRPFTPLRYLWLSLLPGAVVAVAYTVVYAKTFPLALMSPVSGAIGAALLSALGTYVVAQVAIWLPGVTPRKFLYHPRWPWRLVGRRRS